MGAPLSRPAGVHMTPGEDVYDVGVAVWCDICEAPHRSCEDDDDLDLRTEGGVPARDPYDRDEAFR
jgi:hypothetical protein